MPKPEKIEFTSYVKRKTWGPDDTYLTVDTSKQVFEHEGWKKGALVAITIEQLD